MTRLVAMLDAESAPGADTLIDAGRLLDRHYIPTRYPDNLPEGAPTDFYIITDADEAIRAAEMIFAHCRNQAR